jgi:hypothetical protein
VPHLSRYPGGQITEYREYVVKFFLLYRDTAGLKALPRIRLETLLE